MKKIITKKRIFISLILLAIVISGTYFVYQKNKSIKIGVFLHDSDNTQAVDRTSILEWVQDKINNEGGIGGHKIKLVYEFVHVKDWSSDKQIERDDQAEAAMKNLIKKSGADIFIGEGVESLMPIVVEQKKIMISPSDTSGFLFRAYGKKDHSLLRISQSDVAQVRTALHILSQKGVKKISYLGEYGRYGNDYYDWIGFFAKESGIEITSINKYTRGNDIAPYVAEALKEKPEYLVAYALSEDAIAIQRELKRLGSQTKLFLADQSIGSFGNASMIKELGNLAEGIEGTNLSYDPSTDFSKKYEEKFNSEPSVMASQFHDALLLSAYISARQEAKNSESVAESAKKIIYGDGENVSWQETKKGLELIAKGELPNISGATGSLDFDTEYGVDPIKTFYQYWQIVNGKMQAIKIYSTDDSSYAYHPQAGAAVARSQANSKYAKLGTMSDQNELLGEKEDSWAVIVAASNGWNEYRHQADALGVYDRLKQNGIKDDKIILMIYDDVAWAKENKKPGEIFNKYKGKDVRKDAVIDYKGYEVSPEVLAQVLSGKPSDEVPTVLGSDSKDNVFLYLVDHGLPGQVNFNNNKRLSADGLNEMVKSMQINEKYRQLFIMVDTCFGESVGEKISAPGVIYFSGASKDEPSFGAEYDPKLRQWLADEFTYKTLQIIADNPEIGIEELYYKSYNDVIGSHVSLLNYANFGDLKTPISDFIAP